MRYVSATEAKQQLAAMLDAAQREPIVIKRQKREVAVLLSAHEYERLRGMNREALQVFCDRVGAGAVDRGMTEDKLTAILADEE